MAECSVCNVEFDIGSMEVSAVESHCKGEKHKKLIQKQLGVEKFSVPSIPSKIRWTYWSNVSDGSDLCDPRFLNVLITEKRLLDAIF